MKRKYNYDSNCTYSCRYLIVWHTKYRRRVLVDGIEIRLKELIQDFFAEEINIIELEIIPNQVRLLVEIGPKQSVHSTIKMIKGKTSSVLRSEYKELTTKIPTLWTNSYFLTTVGDIEEHVIEEYTNNQKTSQRA